MEKTEEIVTYTTAPADYDWFGTHELGVVGNNKHGKTVRKVAGPANYVESQRDRYGSGCHLAVDEAEWAKLVSYGLVEASPDECSTPETCDVCHVCQKQHPCDHQVSS